MTRPQKNTPLALAVGVFFYTIFLKFLTKLLAALVARVVRRSSSR